MLETDTFTGLVPLMMTLPGSSVHGILRARILEWVAMPSFRRSSQPRDWTQVSCIAGRFFLLSEPQGKPKNTGVGSLSFIQGDIPTQESNQGFLHCRQILYQLSHQYNLNKNLTIARKIGNWILYSLDYLCDVSAILALHCFNHIVGNIL